MEANVFPRPGDPHICHLKDVIHNPRIRVGNYSYHHDFGDPRLFEQNNVLYLYPVNPDRLIIGKFCSIAAGTRFIFNGGNHNSTAFANYPFAIFDALWQHTLPANAS